MAHLSPGCAVFHVLDDREENGSLLQSDHLLFLSELIFLERRHPIYRHAEKGA